MVDPIRVFEQARKPRRKKPYIYKNDKPEPLISVKIAKPVPARAKTHDLDHLDKLIEDDLIHQQTKLKPLKVSDPAQAPTASLAQQLADGNFGLLSTHTPSEEFKADGGSSPTVDLPKSRQLLKDRVAPLLEIIPKLLDGLEPFSRYYTLATEQRKTLSHATMLAKDQWDINWKPYIGPYGLVRQLYVGLLILRSHGKLLARLKNKTVLYWLPDMFATYVLANEIILRLVKADQGCSLAEAEEYMKSHAEYGLRADDVDFADDVDLESVLEKDEKGAGC